MRKFFGYHSTKGYHFNIHKVRSCMLIKNDRGGMPEMLRNNIIYKHIINLVKAFELDGYIVNKIITRFNKVGIMAEHRTAVNYDTGKKKKVFYVEGTSYEMGYLMGLLAENDISSMVVDFTGKVFFSFIKSESLGRIKKLQDLFVSLVFEMSKEAYSGLPAEIRDSIRGIYDGCKKHNPETKVDMKHLIALNVGIDVACSIAYTGDFLMREFAGLRPSDLRLPLMCNAFDVFGPPAGNGHYFGRDFMFPTAGVFQDTAAMVIYNPDNTSDKRVYPFVSITAPGMAGSISAMNINGVAAGVDMSPGINCSPSKIGINSLLLTHLCIQYGGSAEQAVEYIRETPRGVAWNYIIADGRKDKACVIEAGASDISTDFTSFPPGRVKALLPDSEFIVTHKSADSQKGIMVRWNDYKYPDEYLTFNNRLWKHFDRPLLPAKKLYPGAFSEDGYINKSHKERNCPSTFYFAPQRENNDNLIITTNHFIIPEMRFYAMHPWTSMIVGNIINDIQWRYDELNYQVLNMLKTKGFIEYKAAKQLIDFLAPYGRYPSYYEENPRSSDGKEIRIEGCTSLFDLKNRIVESHYGYYCDKWVRLTLPYYVN